MSQYKRILVCVTEHRLAPYQPFFAEFTHDVPAVYLLFIPGKQMLQIRRAVSAADAVVLAHSSIDDVQCRTAKILYGDATADGRLSASISNLFATGTGQVITPKTPLHFVPDEYGVNSRLLTRIDEIAKEYNIPVLAKLPIDPKVAEHVDNGTIEYLERDWFDLAAEKAMEL